MRVGQLQRRGPSPAWLPPFIHLSPPRLEPALCKLGWPRRGPVCFTWSSHSSPWIFLCPVFAGFSLSLSFSHQHFGLLFPILTTQQLENRNPVSFGFIMHFGQGLEETYNLGPSTGMYKNSSKKSLISLVKGPEKSSQETINKQTNKSFGNICLINIQREKGRETFCGRI